MSSDPPKIIKLQDIKLRDVIRVIRLGDPSLWAVIFGNFFSIYMAITQGWNMHEVMWIYWMQSVMIGITNFFRMMSLKEFNGKNLLHNGKPLPETPAGKRSAAFFFLLHYGIFHFVYFIFLWKAEPLNKIPATDMQPLMLCAAAFVISHIFGLVSNFAQDFRDQKPDIGLLMFYPYMRVIPMHLTIIFGSTSEGMGMVIFMVLKTFADIGMHLVERHLFNPPKTAFDGAVQVKD